MYLNSINNFRAIAIIFVVIAHIDRVALIKFDSPIEIYLWNIIIGGTIFFIFIAGFLFHHIFYKRYNFKVYILSKLKNVLDLCKDKFELQNPEVNDQPNTNLSTNLYWIEFDELDHLAVLIDFDHQKMIYKSKNNNIECIQKIYEFNKSEELKEFAREESKLKGAKDKNGYMSLIKKQIEFLGPDSVVHASSLYRWRQFISKTI